MAQLAFDYAPLLVALLGAILGIYGGKWNHHARGLRKLNWTGWTALALAMVGFAVAAGAAHSRREALQREQVERSRVETLAILSIQRALNNLIHPLERTMAVHAAMHGYRSQHDYYGADQFDMGLQRFRDPQFVGAMNDTLVNDLVPPERNESWGSFYESQTGDVAREIDRLLATYGAHVDSEIITQLELLRSNYYLWLFAGSYGGKPRWTLLGGRSLADLLVKRNALGSLTVDLERLTAHLKQLYDPSVFGNLYAVQVTGRYTRADETDRTPDWLKKQMGGPR